MSHKPNHNPESDPHNRPPRVAFWYDATGIADQLADEYGDSAAEIVEMFFDETALRGVVVVAVEPPAHLTTEQIVREITLSLALYTALDPAHIAETDVQRDADNAVRARIVFTY